MEIISKLSFTNDFKNGQKLKFNSKEVAEIFFDATRTDLNMTMDQYLRALLSHAQTNWFSECVFCDLGNKYRVYFSTILTEHGFCQTYNMQLAESMFHLNK